MLAFVKEQARSVDSFEIHAIKKSSRIFEARPETQCLLSPEVEAQLLHNSGQAGDSQDMER